MAEEPRKGVTRETARPTGGHEHQEQVRSRELVSVRGEARVGDVRIVYESWGTGPALVCCHAFAVDRTMWEPQIARFAETHQVITFDQRGSGESDHPVPRAGEPDPYTTDTFAEDLRGVLDDLGIQRARILGLSMGGATALRFATRWPDRVERLVLASTMASRLPDEIIERAKVVEQVLSRDGVRAAYAFYFGGPLFRGVSQESRTVAQMEAWAARATPHGFAGCYRVTIDRPSMSEDLEKVQAPTLILVGEHDTLYLAEAEEMARRIPQARKVIMKGVGHPMNIEAPEPFAEEVIRFLVTLPRGARKEPIG
jgi:pimeloyl-ACP methyl ester carboxylesterase